MTRECGISMCDKCIELDAKIERYQYISRMLTDQQTLDGIQKLVEQMKVEKAALHPEQQQKA
jgi:hypothetical protein